MPRPQITRCVAADFPARLFKPAGVPARDLQILRLTADEVEAFRLVDGDGLLQEAAARQMGVSRPTLNRILNQARRKTAQALGSGWGLAIEPGVTQISAGGSSMIVAVPTQGSVVDSHWGHAAEISLFPLPGSTESPSDVIRTEGGCACKSGVAQTLVSRQVTHVLVGDIGAGAFQALQARGMTVIRGVSGLASEAVQKLAQGSLQDRSGLCGHDDCPTDHGFIPKASQ
jgi:predicted DNA-binding protein (UPF0251 family)/predicted Fe-Mo cluster-binding NifX family protein